MTHYSAQKQDTQKPYGSQWSTELVTQSKSKAIEEAKRLIMLGWPSRVVTQATGKVVFRA